MKETNESTESIQPINNIKFTYHASMLVRKLIMSFGVELDRVEGVSIYINSERENIDEKIYSDEELQSILDKLSQIQFPSHRSYRLPITDASSWELKVNDVEYEGYASYPDFLLNILDVIGYHDLREKYGKAYERKYNV